MPLRTRTQANGAPLLGAELSGDDDIVHPSFSDIEFASGSSDDDRGRYDDDDDDVPDEPAARAPVPLKKNSRRARFEEDDGEGDEEGDSGRSAKKAKVDLEALALQALGRR